MPKIKHEDAVATLTLEKVTPDEVDELICELRSYGPDDPERSLELTVWDHNGLDRNGGSSVCWVLVDARTGLEIIEAAREIIARRRAELVADEPALEAAE